MRTIRIGLLGCGVVGGGLVRLLGAERARIRRHRGLDLDIGRILVRDACRPRQGVDPGLLTTSAIDVVDGDCDVVVELIGGTHTAAALLRRAIERRRHVVTANKALLAAAGAELQRSAARAGVGLGIEASVCGGIPVVRTLQHGLAGDTIEGIRGILNGTCNYVLTRMGEGMSLPDALARAQELGFAESDPTLDLSGRDAMQKLTVLARLAFDVPVRRAECRGLEGLTPRDLEAARRDGRALRQIAEARRVPGGVALSVAVRALEPADPFARVLDEQNAVSIEARAAGAIFLSGRGAGSLPTATAVLADVIAVVAGRGEWGTH